mmetsp:Transcript_31011/g.47945  ORF Transcript_31011/g.47945 Transcript_31011/m.47945 type:complete len:235 (-) Transcript_31011:40-744(-)
MDVMSGNLTFEESKQTALHGCRRPHALPPLRLRKRTRVHHPGRQRVTPDTLPPHFRGQRRGEALQRKFRGHVKRHLRYPHLPRPRRYIHDAPGPRRHHGAAQHGGGDGVRADDVELEQAPQVVGGQRLGRSLGRLAAPRVVDEHVDAAPRVDDGPHRLFDPVGIRHVREEACDTGGVGGERLRFFELRERAGCNGHSGAFTVQTESNGSANSSACSSDEDALIYEPGRRRHSGR